ncbi:MAG: amidohydrolase, partial [Bacteroidia bacterium]|nr:amidohydrolase [Bacteroidia bacterium]
MFSCLFACSFAQQPIPAPPQSTPIWIKQGTLHTASDKGTFVGDIWIENGKITQIGTVENPSTNAIVIEAQGKH